MTPEQLIEATLAGLRAAPPAGIDERTLDSWWARHSKQLEGRVRSKLQPLGAGRIVSLNMGLGRDSFTMLCLLLEGRLLAQRTHVLTEDIAVVFFADTGYEWPHTYNVLPLAIELCRQGGLRWLHLKKPRRDDENGWQAWQEGWTHRHGTKLARSLPPWRHDPPATIEQRADSGYYHQRAPILEDYHTRRSVISVAKQDCTSNHKISPMRRALEDLAFEKFGVESNRAWGADVRKGVRRPHLALIGYAADEGHRLGHEGGLSYVEEAYPLVELGIAKSEEAAILERWHLNQVRKSGCTACPYQPVSWYWALRETDPNGWQKLLQYEADALERNPRMGVLPGRKALHQAVEDWRNEHPEATVEAVFNKAYSRCTVAHKAGAQDGETLEVLPDAVESDPLLPVIQARLLLRHNLRGES